MKELTTKEHLLHFMQSGFMRLSKYDLKFVQNILYIAANQKEITSNQELLFNKLLEKYKRQLEKHKITTAFIKNLPWSVIVKPSDPLYTEAYILIEDGHIYFKSPYNKTFISSFRNIVGNPFVWNKDDRRYEATFSAMALKIIVTTAPKYYNIVNYCPETTRLLDSLIPYSMVDYWSPTLVEVNGQYIIAAINEPLANALGDICLNSDFNTISILAEHGVAISERIIANDPELQFAAQYNPSVDFLELDTLIHRLEKLNCTKLILSGSGLAVQYRRELKQKLASANINIVEGFDDHTEKVVRLVFSTMYLNMHQHGVSKIINMTNSTPINIK